MGNGQLEHFVKLSNFSRKLEMDIFRKQLVSLVLNPSYTILQVRITTMQKWTETAFVIPVFVVMTNDTVKSVIFDDHLSSLTGGFFRKTYTKRDSFGSLVKIC